MINRRLIAFHISAERIKMQAPMFNKIRGINTIDNYYENIENILSYF